MRTFIENYLHLMKNCIRPHYEKLKPLKSGFIENSNFENNRDPWCQVVMWSSDSRSPEKRADGHLLRLPPHYLLGNAAAHRGYYCIPLLFLAH